MSSKNAPPSASEAQSPAEFRYIQYDNHREDELLPQIRQLISKDLSEPYSIYVYRYFLYQWGDLCFLTLDKTDRLVGVVVCKLEPHRGGPLRGYIAMLATQEAHRGKGIATKLVSMAIEAMQARDADEVLQNVNFNIYRHKADRGLQIALETEVTNVASNKLYERLGFLRTKRLHRYYLNGNTAYRLVLYLKEGTALKPYDDYLADAPEPPHLG
ncbi:MAG: N-alpha-acetyltransferase mak3 [Bathelium mastoideum]|nr:MAG: N-alpha-acetyltransferase mak3 [Bathelium mastoideum]